MMVSGYEVSGSPIKKCPGVSTDIPSVLWLLRAVSGHEFKHASIWQVIVESLDGCFLLSSGGGVWLL